MASAYRKGPTFYVSYVDGTGVRRNVATTCSTKTAAKQLAIELEVKAQRQRFGLEPHVGECKLTLTELCEWWLESRCPAPSVSKERSRLSVHIFGSIGKLLVPQVTATRLEDRFRDIEARGAKAASMNKLRATVNSVYVQARKAELWLGPNPA